MTFKAHMAQLERYMALNTEKPRSRGAPLSATTPIGKSLTTLPPYHRKAAMATLYEWTDLDGDNAELTCEGGFSDEIATLYFNDNGGVYLTHPQAKKLRKALKRALEH